MHTHYPGSERRKYVRLDSVLPVQFRFLSLDNGSFLSDWVQGFTNNIGKGGIALRVNNLNPEQAKFLVSGQAKISLEIESPLTRHPVIAEAKVTWVRNLAEGDNKYVVGLVYEKIEPLSNIRLMRYVWTKKIFLPVVFSILFIFGAGFAFNAYVNVKLTRGNRALIGQLIKILQESSIAKQKIKEINSDKEDLELKIQGLVGRIQSLEEEKSKLSEGAKLEEEKTSIKIEELNTVIKRLTQEKTPLQEQLLSLQQKENLVTEELLRLDKTKAIVAQANFDKMYQWLTIHQNPRTGLVMSFEGDTNLANWAFIYDQALVAQAFTNFSDFERARKILDFFAKKAKRKEGLFFNAYYVTDGSPVEYFVHSGPNIWLGVAMLQYGKKTKDNRYLNLAEEIAQAIISLQRQDNDGGIKGGPDVSWYSTEHNLDAYAFLAMLYTITGKEKYLEAKDKIANWLVIHTYDKLDVPIARGKGDATIATDTYAWSIAAIGPEKLVALAMNPDKIIEFAEENCVVEVSYVRPEGQKVTIKGFDFAPQRHLARGGVVSTEWTAQMILSFKIMADYYHKKGLISKARSYELKAGGYLLDLCKMIISSPSPSGQGEGCLPYASSDSVDTGHGWTTPQGKYTGSLAGTAYTLFAYYNYNPLELKEN